MILNTSGKEREKGTMSSGDVLKLRHGEKAQIDGLPHKASYKVEEINPGSYYVKKYNSAGVLEAGKEMTARFVNSTKPSLIQTGQNWILPLTLAIAGMTLALTGVLFFRKKRR